MVDSRLPAQVQRFAFGGVPVIAAPLAAGDFWLTCEDGALLVVGLKTPTEFLAAIASNRLYEQARAMRDYSPWSYLLVEGHFWPAANDGVWAGTTPTESKEYPRWTFSSVQGALQACQECGVIVVHCNGLLDLEPALLRLAAHNRSPKRVAPARDLTVIDEREAFLLGIPSIGPEKAQALLAACDGLGAALFALTDLSPQNHVVGIGPETRKCVRAFFDLAPDQVLAPWTQFVDGTEAQSAAPVLNGQVAEVGAR